MARSCKYCIKVGVCEIYDIVQYNGHAIGCGSFIDTADVIPKSEYDNLKSQFEALDHECDRLERAESNRHDAIEQAKTEVAMEIFAEIELLIEKYAFEPNYSMQNMEEDIASLKKKYTEAENDR